MKALLRRLIGKVLEECRVDGTLKFTGASGTDHRNTGKPGAWRFCDQYRDAHGEGGEKTAPRRCGDPGYPPGAKHGLFLQDRRGRPRLYQLHHQGRCLARHPPRRCPSRRRLRHKPPGAGKKVQVEFVSANPTGPLHIGHGRGAAIGDALSRLLAASGWDVTREFYYNDAGQQIANLALSVQARCLGIDAGDPRWPTDGYQGDYIRDVARSYLAGETVDADDQHATGSGDPNDLNAIRRFAVAYLRREQDADLAAFGVHFDVTSLESSLYEDGRVEAAVQRLVESGYCYEQDGALWLRTTAFGDDKDRVMRKSDGSYTYFVPDIAYHLDKWERGFSRVINEQGRRPPQHHHQGPCRLAGSRAGIPQGWPDYVLHQMVTVMRGGEEVEISKRAGSYVTLRDLIDEAGCDATRFFFVMRKPDSQLVFDLDLAKQQSLDNPVYYVQYAHARICSIFENALEKGFRCRTWPTHLWLDWRLRKK